MRRFCGHFDFQGYASRGLSFRFSFVSTFYFGLKSIILSCRYIFGIPVCIVSSPIPPPRSFGSAETSRRAKRKESVRPGDHLSAINLPLLFTVIITFDHLVAIFLCYWFRSSCYCHGSWRQRKFSGGAKSLVNI